MFLGRMIRRRLLSLLGPRLLEPPVLELKIGIVHSHVIAKNLRFDASVLNALLEDSSNVSFKELTIENFTVRFSNWSVYALSIEFSGVRVVLSARENDHGGRSSPVDTTYTDLEKELYAMDPEGRVLHEVLRKLCVAMPSSEKSRISIWNLIFRHCQLVVHDIKVHLQLPMVNDCILGFWEVEELAIVSQYLEQRCILRDFLGMIFAPLRESTFLVSWNDFEIGFRRNDQMTRVLFCKDLLSSSKFKDLQFVDANLHIPELRISFSPIDVVVCLAFQKALSRKVKHPRTGKQLWKVAARRISTVSSVTRFSLHRLVTETILWLRYANSYEHLLLLVGYPSSNLLKRSALRMLEDKSFISMVRHQWKLISEAEKELKPDAILQGRRIARNRLSRDIHVPVGGSQYFFSHHLTGSCKILAGLRFLAKLVYGVFYFILRFGSLGRIGTQGKQTDGSSDLNPKECFLEKSFILYFENVSITFSPNKEFCLPLNGIGASRAWTSSSQFQHFCIKFGSFSLKYVDNIFEQSLFTSCAKFGMSSTLICSDAVTGIESTSATLTKEGKQNGDSTGLETLIWGEPVEKYSSLANRETEIPPDLAVGVGQSYLQKFLRELWIDWEATSQIFEELNSSLMENPFLLFEMTSALSYTGPRILDSASCRCNLMVGRLHIALGCFSTLSISVLLMQMLHAFSLGKDTEKSSLADTASSSIDNLMIDTKVKLGSYSDRIKMLLLEMLPEKNIQLGVFISGPRVRMSFEKDGLDYSKSVMDYDQSHDFQLKFDVHDIELAIWPAVELGLDPPTRSEEHEDVVEKPRTHDISTENDRKYTFEILLSLGLYLRACGVDAYMENLTEKQQTQILSLSPIMFELSIYRKYVHSLSGTYVILSTALNGITSGFMAQLCMDVIYVISQEVQGLFTAVSVNTAMVGSECLKESLLQYLEVVDPDKENSMLKGPILLDKSTFFMKGTFKMSPMDLVFQYSMNNTDMSNSMKRFDAIKLDKHNVFNCGMWVSIKDISVDISCGEGTPNVLICIDQVQLAVIKGWKRSINVLNKMLFQSLSCCYEASVSNTTFAMYCDFPVGKMSNGRNISACNPSTSNDPQKSSARSSLGKNLPATVAPCSSQWLHINIAVGQIIIGRHSVTDLLLGAHETRELLLSLSVGGEFQIISSRIQGGLLMVETEALVMFLGSYNCLLQHAKKNLYTLWSSNQMRKDGSAAARIALNDNLGEVNVQDIPSLSNQTGWGRLELLTFDTSTFSIMFAAEEEPGVVRQIMLELHIKLNLELANTRKKFQFDPCRVSVTSQVLYMNMDHQVQIPHFASMTTRGLQGGLAKPYEYQDRTGSFENGNTISHMSVDTSTITVVRTGQQKFILNNAGGSIHGYMIYDGHTSLDGSWIGDGSLSGFDMTISLPEIQMILSAVGSFSSISTKENSSNSQSKEERQRDSHNQVDYIEHNFEEIVPDGAIVAIQDVDQHMFFAVDGGRDTYSVVGALHYSLVGERAFFQVRYHKEIGWRSSISWFSLMSLHAKDGSGEPLHLTYRRGRGSVEVFSSYDSRSSLFRAVSWKPGNFEGDIGWETYNQLVKSTFYLVNKKNSCALAFVNGVPTFVKKPGNPFKFRVFQGTYLPHNLSIQNGFSAETSRPENQYVRQTEERSQQQQGHCFPLIKIKAEKISVTVVHEHLDEQDRVPLLNFGIADILLNVQILPAKVRMICTLQAWLDYFDSQRKSWRHLIHPVEIYSYYRNRLSVGTDIVKQGAPGCFYCRAKEVDVSLNEISLDIPLFVVGKLNIAGPYSVRSSTILSNYCKVENQSRANLLCQFYEKQSVKVAGGQCASVHMRHQFWTNESSEPPPTVSVQLAFLESFTTSQIQLSLSETQVFAWKTRIVSNEGSKTFPGPFIIVDITRKSEDGLSIVVSPLIRVHNETKFSMELRFQRPQQAGDEYVVSLKMGEALDDSMAMFEAISSSGGLKKAITSLGVGNFLLSFRPEIPEINLDDASSSSVDWSDDIKGGKSVFLSGVLDKLNYKVRKALSSESTKISFTTACCTIGTINSMLGELHFLIKSCTRGVPIKHPDKPRGGNEPAVALQEQKEIFLLPTFRVFNFLQSEIHVFLTDTDRVTANEQHTIGNQATISCGSAADFYVNPAKVFFNVTLTAYQFSCKPLNSSNWVRSLLKRKKETGFLDVDLDFAGKCFASLRLSRGSDGILEAFIFTPYTLKNETGLLLFVCQPNQKLPFRDETDKTAVDTSPDIGVLLPPNSSQSWFLKSNKVQIKMLEADLCETLLELDSLSGLSEIRLEMEDKRKVRCFTKFGIAVGPAFSKLDVPARTVTMVPRYVVLNNSEENIIARQCYLEDDMTGVLTIKSKQREMLLLREIRGQTEFSLFENFIRKHRNTSEDSTIYIQFQSNNSESSWSGPICVASLGCFFLKFRKKQSNELLVSSTIATEYANVHVAEEGPSLVMRFYKPPVVKLPYRIENCLHDALITYYQKDSSEPEVLQPQHSTDYVWDDLTLPHKLVVQISDIHQLHEINLDKVREWKSFFKSQRYEGLSSQVLTKRKSLNKRNNVVGFEDIMKVGYEVYADGPTRVLCISKASGGHKEDKVSRAREKIRIRVPGLTIHMTELKEVDEGEPSVYTPFLISRLAHVNVDALFTGQQNYCNISVQSLDVVPKWVGVPFAAMVRRHHSESDDSSDCILKILIVLRSSSSNVKQVQYSSIVLQPIDLNLDEETLMKLVPFWRTSLSESSTPSRQFYFDHFEIHPIKIFMNFVPGDSYSSYSSAQETLRSFIHSVVKIPPIKNMVVELNGVLVTHALVTMRELSIKCAQHYTWYAMRAIYIAKGSPLLPPGFASIFDDLASSSLDVFFDPSKALMKLPGLTLGTFKLISKSIGGKDFSGTKRYFGDLEKTLRTAGSNVMFAAVTEVSDSVLRGAETSGFDGMIRGFHQGILKLAMEPSVLGSALLEGGPDRVIELDESPGMEELYIEGYLQAMLDAVFKQEYLTVRVVDNQVFLKNLPPSSTLMEEVMDRVKGVLISRGLLKGDPLAGSRPLRHLRGDNTEWRIGPTVFTLCEHLVVSFAIRMLRKQATKATYKMKSKVTSNGGDDQKDEGELTVRQSRLGGFIWRWGIGRFVLSGLVAYVDGRLCRHIPHPMARRIVSGFLLSFLDKNDTK